MSVLIKNLNFIEQKVVLDQRYINIDEALPHEEVMNNRLDAMINYIDSLSPHTVIPSILISEDNVIIDGHHRYHALKEKGFKQLPVHVLKYNSQYIVTHNEPEKLLKKSEIIQRAKHMDLMTPKSTMHHIMVNNKLLPIILLSKLSYIEK